MCIQASCLPIGSPLLDANPKNLFGYIVHLGTSQFDPMISNSITSCPQYFLINITIITTIIQIHPISVIHLSIYFRKQTQLQIWKISCLHTEKSSLRIQSPSRVLLNPTQHPLIFTTAQGEVVGDHIPHGAFHRGRCLRQTLGVLYLDSFLNHLVEPRLRRLKWWFHKRRGGEVSKPGEAKMGNQYCGTSVQS